MKFTTANEMCDLAFKKGFVYSIRSDLGSYEQHWYQDITGTAKPAIEAPTSWTNGVAKIKLNGEHRWFDLSMQATIQLSVPKLTSIEFFPKTVSDALGGAAVSTDPTIAISAA